jgi:large subunit ribosomal protein L23
VTKSGQGIYYYYFLLLTATFSNMQLASRLLRRSYATHIRAREGRILSAPKAVRERRAARGLDKDSPRSGNDLTPAEFAYYQRALALGELMGKGRNGGEPSAKEWLKQLNLRRNRVRGIRIEKQKGGRKEVVAMGQKVYLPNIIFRMVRNHTPPGMPYNPYEATFRLPLSVTTTDIRSYLLAVYGVETTYIRTGIFASPLYRSHDGGYSRTKQTYKKAVVGLVEPFAPPPSMDDLKDAAQRKGLQERYEDAFNIRGAKIHAKMHLLRSTKKGSDKWTWRNIATTKRGQILKAIGEARWKREHALMATKALMDRNRAQGLPAGDIDFKEMKRLAEES